MSLVMTRNADRLPATEHDPRWLSVVIATHRPTVDSSMRSEPPASTAARLARREGEAGKRHVHATCEEAETAGYRACRRCSPNAASLAERNAATIVEACRLIEAAEEPPKLDDLAASVGMSPFHLHRQFKAITGLTPKPTERLIAPGRFARNSPRRAA
jgi:AraC family transcriptional regulator of adaptative response/methylated-DNA-[protein]-cysteine methyltransferase